MTREECHSLSFSLNIIPHDSFSLERSKFSLTYKRILVNTDAIHEPVCQVPELSPS